MGMFDWIGTAAKAVVHGVEDTGHRVGDRLDDVEQWFGDLFSGHLGAQAMSVPEVVEKVTGSQGATDWHSGAGMAITVARDHRAVATQIQNISSGLESVWTGSGAEAAQARLKLLGEVADSAAQTFEANSTHVTGIASGFDEMKRALTPLPSSPPHKDFWDVVTPWDTDTEDQDNRYNAQIQENLNRYNAYAQQAQDTARQLSIDYGQIGTFGGNVNVVADDTTSTTNHPTPSNAANAAVNRLDTPHATPPHTGGSVTTATPGPGDASSDGRSPESPRHEGTTASAYVPPGQTATSYGIPSGGGPSPALDVLGGLGMGAIGGFVGTGGGVGSGNLGRGGSIGGGAPAGGQPGTGNRTGAGPHRVPGAAAAVEKAGSTGRDNTGGLGAGATGAGRGKGEGDEEHHRKYGIQDDSLFVDHGERLVDPATGLHVTPPTIGC